ncbi:hypothetical protein [Nocardia aurea]|uniref:hypothetical protein n=1 Tax=Nocardia aurea TaxID=2144174 RepID=UPI0033BCB3C3
MDSDAAELLDILEQVLAHVRSGPQDLVWQSRYEDEDELVADLTEQCARIRRGDRIRLRYLRTLFLATGPLCEIAASSGWLEPFTALGARFDQLTERGRSR